jgi:hypothetical protein
MRPAPQGRAYRERRHFCHITILLSNDEKLVGNGKGRTDDAKPAKLAESKARKRGGAAAAPRAKRTPVAAKGGDQPVVPAPDKSETTAPETATATETKTGADSSGAE